MSRAAGVIVMFVAVLAGACGEGDGTSSSPTGPTATGGSQTPGPGCTPPGAPANLAVSVTGTSVVLTWSAATGAMDYMILVGTTPSSSNTLSTNTSQTTYPWSGVSPGTYYVRIQSRNACGTSGSSNEVSFRV